MKKIKISCADFTFPLLPHDKVLDLIAMLDCEGVDIGLFTGRSHIQAGTEFDRLEEKAKLLQQKAADRGLAIADIYLQLDNDLAKFAINHPDAKKRNYAREQFLKLIEYAQYANAEHITCLPGMTFPDIESLTDSVQRSYEELSWRVEQVNKTSLSFSIEAHVGSPYTDPKEVVALVKSVPGLYITLDYTHFIRNGYSQQEADILLPYANHFHARGAQPGKLQSSVADNTIDYEKIVQQLKAGNYAGWIGLEYIWIKWEQCNQADTLSETILLRDILLESINKSN
ncbi:MAG: sugar phosphate isomerase/epimerase [Chitinophagaceae bacterium]|nr:sugar phosphate isomerase/epimerase [Chitinophagaceae bacterium]